MDLLKLLFNKSLKWKFLIIVPIALLVAVRWKFPAYFGAGFVISMIVILLIIGWIAVKAFSAGSFLLKMNSGTLTAEENKNGLDSILKGTEMFFGKGFASTVKSATGTKDIPDGIPATATVINSRQGNTKMKMGIQEIFQLIIEVNVINNNDETWHATLTEMVPITQISAFQSGARFAVKYDPNNRMNICIDQNPPTASQQNYSVDIPGYGTATSEQARTAMQNRPKDITLKLQAVEVIREELKTTGVQTTATVLKSKLLFEGYVTGNDVYQLDVEVNANTKFEADTVLLIGKPSLFKIENGKTVYVLYDSHNPQRICLTGLDKPDSSNKLL